MKRQRKRKGKIERLNLREFIVYSRKGKTTSRFSNLRDAGRLDIVHECIEASLFLSHGIRRDVVFHAILSGPPSPPLHLKIDGSQLRDVRTDQATWEGIFRKVLSGKPHPGISIHKNSFESLLKEKSFISSIYVLEEGGKNISEVRLEENPIFVLGDHIGLPRKVEGFALRYGCKISLGKKPYLAASCITILNYLLDKTSRR
jgi:tRNA (pseudouridine54-N1)-methyltransferase